MKNKILLNSWLSVDNYIAGKYNNQSCISSFDK